MTNMDKLSIFLILYKSILLFAVYRFVIIYSFSAYWYTFQNIAVIFIHTSCTQITFRHGLLKHKIIIFLGLSKQYFFSNVDSDNAVCQSNKPKKSWQSHNCRYTFWPDFILNEYSIHIYFTQVLLNLKYVQYFKLLVKFTIYLIVTSYFTFVSYIFYLVDWNNMKVLHLS